MSFATPCVHHAEAWQGWGGAHTSLQAAKMALCVGKAYKTVLSGEHGRQTLKDHLLM